MDKSDYYRKMRSLVTEVKYVNHFDKAVTCALLVKGDFVVTATAPIQGIGEMNEREGERNSYAKAIDKLEEFLVFEESINSLEKDD